MLYREAGQFKSTYGEDQQIFPIRQDRIAMGLLLIVAVVVVPLRLQSMLRTALEPMVKVTPLLVPTLKPGARMLEVVLAATP